MSEELVGEIEKWVKIRLFTSTWNVWKQHTVLMKNYDRELDAVIEIEEFEPSEDQYPSMRFVSQPHGFCLADGQSYELIAVLPSEAKDKVVELWRKLWNLDEFALAKEMLSIIYEYDENPVVEIHFDEYETRIEIN